MSDEKPAAPAADPGYSGCIGMLLSLTFLAMIWMAACLLLYAYVSQEAAAVAFFLPPVGLMLWAMFTKPSGAGDGPQKPSS